MNTRNLITALLVSFGILISVSVGAQSIKKSVGMQVHSMYALHLDGNQSKDPIRNAKCEFKLQTLYLKRIHVDYFVQGTNQIAYASIPQLHLKKIPLHPLGLDNLMIFMSDQSFPTKLYGMTLNRIIFRAPHTVQLLFNNDTSSYQCLAKSTFG